MVRQKYKGDNFNKSFQTSGYYVITVGDNIIEDCNYEVSILLDSELYLVIQDWIITEVRSIILDFVKHIVGRNKKSLEGIIENLEKENSGPDHNSFLESQISGLMDVEEYQREQFNRYNYLAEI